MKMYVKSCGTNVKEWKKIGSKKRQSRSLWRACFDYFHIFLYLYLYVSFLLSIKHSYKILQQMFLEKQSTRSTEILERVNEIKNNYVLLSEILEQRARLCRVNWIF